LDVTALDLLADWPVTNAAAAVVTGGGSVTTVGDVQHGFRLASVTKLLSAYAGLLAVQEGVVALDDEAGPPGSTVRHLLAHASGLAFDDEVVQAAPGTRRIYSNAGFAVLGRAVEEASGFEFADYLTEAVFRPLSMDTTALRGPAGHGAFAGVADLTRFAGELLRPRLLEAEILSAATTVQFPGLAGVLPGYGRQVPNDWGLGFEIRDGKHPHWTGTHNSPGTFGQFGAAGTFLWVDPVADLALIVLTDRDFGDWCKPLWPVLADAVLADAAGTADAAGAAGTAGTGRADGDAGSGVTD
jgi:CubicO group peptidase (beta-lactamase class C family)